MLKNNKNQLIAVPRSNQKFNIYSKSLTINNHIILIGFKHVGKTTLGKAIAKIINCPFIDLDREIEYFYENKYKSNLSCREIMHTKGEFYFRKIESEILGSIIKRPPSIIALGGGTPLSLSNQKIIQKYSKIHIIGPRNHVFKRIMSGGRPPFFNSDINNPYQSFIQLWTARIKVYQKLTSMQIYHATNFKKTINQMLAHLSQEVQKK